MLKVQKNKSLKELNTFGIEAIADTFIQINQNEELHELATNKSTLQKPIYILGSGANTLFTSNYNGTIIHINTKGIELIEENNEYAILEVQSGEIWDNLIDFCVENNYYGIENLVAIPSTVGASAIQNIGAYGMEAKDSIYSVKYIDFQNFKNHEISNKDCHFAYRDSIFKNELKDKIIITSVKFKLFKKANLILNYGSIKTELISQNISSPTLSQITSIIRKIRNSKLPDPKLIGNAGSFFKNPIIPLTELEILKSKFPKIVSYKVSEKKGKVAAGWLIEYANLKGYQIGGAAVHKAQSLVIINKDNAKPSDIVNLAKYIQKEVKLIFNINLIPEVIFI